MYSRNVFVWAGWAALTAVGAVYVVLCVWTFANVKEIWDVEVDGSSNVTRALLGSTLMSALLTIMYLVIAFLVILGRWCSAETDAGLWFGVLMGATWTMAFVYAQAGISTQAFDDKAVAWQNQELGNWTSGDTATLRATFSFAYILALFVLAYFFVLLSGKSAFARQPTRRPNYELSSRPDVVEI